MWPASTIASGRNRTRRTGIRGQKTLKTCVVGNRNEMHSQVVRAPSDSAFLSMGCSGQLGRSTIAARAAQSAARDAEMLDYVTIEQSRSKRASKRQRVQVGFLVSNRFGLEPLFCIHLVF